MLYCADKICLTAPRFSKSQALIMAFQNQGLGNVLRGEAERLSEPFGEYARYPRCQRFSPVLVAARQLAAGTGQAS